MKVKNVHIRKLKQPKTKVAQMLKTLATKEDKIWPYKQWPAMRFKDGLKVGSKGGHGIIRYTIVAFEPEESIRFKFTKPEGFTGTHELRIKALSENETIISHEIIMDTTTVKATFFWITVIRWLHDALIEDAFDNVENQFSTQCKSTNYNFWVKVLRQIYKPKAMSPKPI